jgi:hypothetical protein
MHRLALIPVALMTLIACDAFKGATNPLVSQGLILGIEAPESDQIDLSGTDYDEGTAASIFLADAKSVDDLDNAPIEGADVAIRGPGDMGSVEVVDAGGGLYTVLPSDGTLDYQDGADWTVVAQEDPAADQGKANVHLPPGPNVNVTQQHDAGQPVHLDLAGQGFTAVIAVVVDVETGEVTFSNEPKDIKAIYDFTRGNDEVPSFDVPGTAFPDHKAYALGVAGMQHTQAEDLDGMNTLLTSVMAGKMRMFPVITAQAP